MAAPNRVPFAMTPLKSFIFSFGSVIYSFPILNPRSHDYIHFIWSKVDVGCLAREKFNGFEGVEIPLSRMKTFLVNSLYSWAKRNRNPSLDQLLDWFELFHCHGSSYRAFLSCGFLFYTGGIPLMPYRQYN